MKTKIIQKDGKPSGKWFNPESAIVLNENTHWDGHNWVSNVVPKHHHQALYYTKSGVFVLKSYSDFAYSETVYEEIDITDAADWIVRNEFDDLSVLNMFPSDVQEQLLELIRNKEV